MPTLDDLWEFNDPSLSESRFRGALEDGIFEPAETLTQLARSLGLQRRFEEAHQNLDLAERAAPSPRASLRILLERGRAYNSAGEKIQARCLFEEAWQVALSIREEALAVDAAHMVAITHSNGRALEWNQRAMTLAEASHDPKARRWLGSLHNNIGWTYHDDLQDYGRALDHFERALAARLEQGDERSARIARWSIARCLRSMSRYQEALQMQSTLLESEDGDGFVFEELGECLLALHRQEEARTNFQKAFHLLSQDPNLREHEPARLDRIRTLATF